MWSSPENEFRNGFCVNVPPCLRWLAFAISCMYISYDLKELTFMQKGTHQILKNSAIGFGSLAFLFHVWIWALTLTNGQHACIKKIGTQYLSLHLIRFWNIPEPFHLLITFCENRLGWAVAEAAAAAAWRWRCPPRISIAPLPQCAPPLAKSIISTDWKQKQFWNSAKSRLSRHLIQIETKLKLC